MIGDRFTPQGSQYLRGVSVFGTGIQKAARNQHSCCRLNEEPMLRVSYELCSRACIATINIPILLPQLTRPTNLTYSARHGSRCPRLPRPTHHRLDHYANDYDEIEEHA
jgi:hypothetical protein